MVLQNMNLSKFVNKYVYEIFSIILILCVVDQIYMMLRYKNISIETLIITLVFAAINIYFGFLHKK